MVDERSEWFCQTATSEESKVSLPEAFNNSRLSFMGPVACDLRWRGWLACQHCLASNADHAVATMTMAVCDFIQRLYEGNAQASDLQYLYGLHGRGPP